jgi:hypothetical protein
MQRKLLPEPQPEPEPEPESPPERRIGTVRSAAADWEAIDAARAFGLGLGLGLGI